MGNSKCQRFLINNTALKQQYNDNKQFSHCNACDVCYACDSHPFENGIIFWILFI